VESAGWDELTGWGGVNAYNSLSILDNPAGHMFRQLVAGSCGDCNVATEMATAEHLLRGVPCDADSVVVM